MTGPWKAAREVYARDPGGVLVGARVGVALFFAVVVPVANAIIR